MDNQKIIDESKPIILNKIRQYGRYIKGYEFEDLLNEGYIAALEAVNKWQGKRENSANIFAWAWLRIDCRFKELAKIGYIQEESLDDVEYEIGDEHIDNVIGDFFGTTSSASSLEDDFEECLEEVKEAFRDTPDKFDKFLTLMLGGNHSSTAIAASLGVTKARISQIMKKFKTIMDANKSSQKAA